MGATSRLGKQNSMDLLLLDFQKVLIECHIKDCAHSGLKALSVDMDGYFVEQIGIQE